MAIGKSALIPILQGEPEGHDFIQAIESQHTRYMSAASFLEASIFILQRFGDDRLRALDLYIIDAGIEIKFFDAVQVKLARNAFQKFGKSRHPASLKFGDRFPYALAKLLIQPLLFEGNDFSKTDIDQYQISVNQSHRI